MSALSDFHPAVERWFTAHFPAPTPPQQAAWPAIRAGRDTLIAAPTGSGKTLAAFLAAIDVLVREAIAGQLADATQIVYVSPLKALSNDIQRNLEQPLAGIDAELLRLGLPGEQIRSQVRTGDTPAAARTAMWRKPPHILVTTPESLYLLLTSVSGRKLLATTRSVIVDEIHALAGNKRGAHLALSLERLEALCGRRLQRIGLSATQKPIEVVADFLGGDRAARGVEPCTIVDTGHVRARDLQLLLPPVPLEAVMSNEAWEVLYDRLATLIQEHRTTLVFANTRRMVERVARHLSERLGERQVAAHHGSLAKEHRLAAEQRLKAGELQALVATASLELGIDIGNVDLVCQLGTSRSIATLLQRAGRANHGVGGVPKARLVPLSRDELVEGTALLAAARAGQLDALSVPPGGLDVLAQQLVAEVSAQEYSEEALFALVRRAFPYRSLPRGEFDAVVGMLSEGISTRRGRQSAYLHRDAVHRRLRARRGARLSALTSGGAIPDTADYRVVLEPSGLFIGTLNEDFAVESLAGDIFQLGNCSYRILRVEAGQVRVEDARGQPPTMPFWLGEAPARSNELSAAVSALRARLDAALPPAPLNALTSAIPTEGIVEAAPNSAVRRCIEWAAAHYQLSNSAAQQLVEYLAAAKAMLGGLPTQQRLVFERFFDEAGDMHLVIHSPFGSRLNRALGLLLRKRFCRAFNFELQAAATEDAIVLSLGETHSFALEDLPRFLSSHTATALLEQALLDAPLFLTRWRWNTTISLAVPRSRAGRKTPAPLQRMAAEDLLSVVFPEQLACGENLRGEREIPHHPLVQQTMYDCLHEALDVDGLLALLRALERGELAVLMRDLPQPSPLAQEILSARPYAYLDDAPLEERRTRAVTARRWLDPESAAELGQLSPEAIGTVCEQAKPSPESADELHDVLMLMGAMDAGEAEAAGLDSLGGELRAQCRATRLHTDGRVFWVAAEQLPMLRAIYSDARLEDALQVPAEHAARVWERESAIRELLRGRLQVSGPIDAAALSATLVLPLPAVEAGLIALETEGFVLRGHFHPAASQLQWCERRLLARIHRYTLKSLRAEIEPVSSGDFMRFLLEWQGVTRHPRPEGTGGLESIIEQLEGFQVAAAAWEADVLPARLAHYESNWLDGLCLSGRVFWARLDPPQSSTAAPVRATPIVLLTRKRRAIWQELTAPAAPAVLSANAAALADYLAQQGASFFDEMRQGAALLPTQAETALAELVAAGYVSADSYSGLRALLAPLSRRRRTGSAANGLEEAGRWSLVRRPTGRASAGHDAVATIASLLLQRYGVIFRRLLTREPSWLPPWHELLRAYRRLEAQGRIRGGRFVGGVSGEQYALPEAVGALRAVRRRDPDGDLTALSAADPLNLVGIVTPGMRVPALAGNRVLLKDGVTVAIRSGGEVQWLAPLSPEEQWRGQNALLRSARVAARARVSLA